MQLGLNDGTPGDPVGIGLELQHIRLEQHHLQQVVKALLGLGGYRHANGVAAPLLGYQAIFRQLLFDPLRIRSIPVYLVDGHDDGHPRGFGMVNGLHGLGHNAVVRSHHQDNHVRHLGASSTHGGECLVTRGIDEGNLPAVAGDRIGADMLGDAAGLPLCDAALADGIQQAGLAMIHVAHNRDHRGPGFHILLSVHLIHALVEHVLGGFCQLLLHLDTILAGDEGTGIKIDLLIDGGHDP